MKESTFSLSLLDVKVIRARGDVVTLSFSWLSIRNGNFSMGRTDFFFLEIDFYANKTLICIGALGKTR